LSDNDIGAEGVRAVRERFGDAARA
jgi:hypothetical protein